jgi:hypothetical protein
MRDLRLFSASLPTRMMPCFRNSIPLMCSHIGSWNQHAPNGPGSSPRLVEWSSSPRLVEWMQIPPLSRTERHRLASASLDDRADQPVHYVPQRLRPSSRGVPLLARGGTAANPGEAVLHPTIAGDPLQQLWSCGCAAHANVHAGKPLHSHSHALPSEGQWHASLDSSETSIRSLAFADAPFARSMNPGPSSTRGPNQGSESHPLFYLAT